MQNNVKDCIKITLLKLNELLPRPLELDQDDDCVIYGENGLDSISLVLFISLLEKNIEDEFGLSFGINRR